MNPIGVGIIGAGPGNGWAAATHVPALQALPQYASARGASTVGANMTADSEETSCALQS
jgi:predicted dehydrogenase